MFCFRFVSIALFVLAMCGGAVAQPQADVEAAYRRTYRAAALKYLPGMYAHRASGFKAYDLDGYPMNPTEEKVWLADFLSKALSLQESGSVAKFRMLSDGEAECEVLDTIEAELFANLQKTSLQRVKLTTRSKDRWKLTDHGWRLASSRLLEQDYKVVENGR